MLYYYYRTVPPDTPASSVSHPASRPFDVIVVGLGAMGSAVTYHLARRGANVLGIDRYAPPHAHGSSHGKSRIIREAYFEHPLYVPLIQQAYERWDDLERESGQPLLTLTGGLMLGHRDSPVAAGALRSALAYDLPHEELDTTELRQRFPAFAVRDDTVALWEPRAGILDPDACIRAHIGLATHLGATVRTGEKVTGWSAGVGGVRVTTEREEYLGATLVLAAGAWLAPLVPELHLPLTIQRAVLYWFRPARDAATLGPERFPIFIWEYEPGRIWYGFPDTGDGVKVALHHLGETTDPETVRRTVGEDEIAYMRSLVREYIPAAAGPLLETAVCMYTNTPDLHFLIDRHPRHERVVLVSPCSGHGFKFASAIGEQVAALVLDGNPSLDLSAFALSRGALGHG